MGNYQDHLCLYEDHSSNFESSTGLLMYILYQYRTCQAITLRRDVNIPLTTSCLENFLELEILGQKYPTECPISLIDPMNSREIHPYIQLYFIR